MAYANGARSMTHVYNGMSPFNTVPTVWWAQLTASAPCTARSSVTLPLHPAALNNYFMSKGPDYAIMVSDA